jgi:hypothetical protein
VDEGLAFFLLLPGKDSKPRSVSKQVDMRELQRRRKNVISHSVSMSMELSSNSMGGEDALPLFWGGGAKLPGNFEPC